jgi:hypothetical protein
MPRESSVDELKNVVIGYKWTEEKRREMWNDLLDSKRSARTFKNSSDYEERRVAAIDADFFARHIAQYLASNPLI